MSALGPGSASSYLSSYSRCPPWHMRSREDLSAWSGCALSWSWARAVPGWERQKPLRNGSRYESAPWQCCG